MRDCTHQRELAQAMAVAPELLRACELLVQHAVPGERADSRVLTDDLKRVQRLVGRARSEVGLA
jgi:hypothetical protein